MRPVVGEFVEIVAVRIDRGWTCVLLRNEVLEESPYDLSHDNSPLALIFGEENTTGQTF